jgi:hypothetical protein
LSLVMSFTKRDVPRLPRFVFGPEDPFIGIRWSVPKNLYWRFVKLAV